MRWVRNSFLTNPARKGRGCLAIFPHTIPTVLAGRVRQKDLQDPVKWFWELTSTRFSLALFTSLIQK